MADTISGKTGDDHLGSPAARFEALVRQIAAVPKAAVDAVDSVENESAKRASDAKKKAS